MKLHGVIPAMVTPTTYDGDIHVERIRSFTRYLIEAGVHGLLLAGSTGEGPLLTSGQRQALIRAVVEEASGRVPVLAGVGAASTAQSIAFSKEAEAAGAAAVAVLPMHLVPVSQDELYGYFATVADSVSIPTALYNFPALTGGQKISAEVAARLARTKNVIALKDSSGDFQNMLGYIEACGPDFAVFTGDEGLLVKILDAGGAGTVCSAGNLIPELLCAIYSAYRAGERENAERLQKETPPLREAVKVGTFPAAIKAGCDQMGYPAGPPIPPASPLEDGQRAALWEVLGRVRSVTLR
ncbi:MAG TPA: dihydrodipicolinate synthase family protein [Capsulimonadaceae bacterium]|nr:dihydrodipicolinate synthase family protein [Capsulimonadaceae bacterium]